MKSTEGLSTGDLERASVKEFILRTRLQPNSLCVGHDGGARLRQNTQNRLKEKE